MTSTGCVSSARVIVQENQAHAVVVLTPDAHAWQPPAKSRRRRKSEPAPGPYADVRLAADELCTHLELMTGVKLETVAKGTDLAGRIPIYLDQAADPGLDKLIKAKGSDPASFAIVVTGDSVSVRGLSAEGTLFGVYDLLEQLGVRWFMPGDLGRVVPKLKTVAIPPQQTVQIPSFPSRWAAGYAGKFKTWQRRLRMGGPYFPPAHGVHLPKGYEFDQHPEYYALIDGVRKKRQLCVSNPQVVAGAIETVRASLRQNPDKPWVQ